MIKAHSEECDSAWVAFDESWKTMNAIAAEGRTSTDEEAKSHFVLLLAFLTTNCEVCDDPEAIFRRST